MDEDVGILEHHFHPLRVCHKVGREVAAVELHALDHVHRGFKALRLLDGDYTFLAHLLHCLRDDVSNGGIPVGGDGTDLGDFLGVLGRPGHSLELVRRLGDALLDAPFNLHRVVAGGHELATLAVDGLREDGGSGCSIASDFGGLGGDLLDHLCTHVLESILELDLLGYGDAILGDGRRAERLLEHDVAAFRPERDLDCVSKGVDTAKDRLARRNIKKNVFGHWRFLSRVMTLFADYFSITPRTSSSRSMRCSSPSILTSFPAYLMNSTRSPGLMSSGRILPSSSTLPLPTATTRPSNGFSLAVSGMMMPPLVFSSSEMRFRMMRSCRGRIFIVVSFIDVSQARLRADALRRANSLGVGDSEPVDGFHWRGALTGPPSLERTLATSLSQCSGLAAKFQPCSPAPYSK